MTLKLPLSLLAATLFVTGCVTSSQGLNWSVWKEIDPGNSTVAVALPADAEVAVKRRKDKYNGTIEEIWEWPTGLLHIVKFPQARYSRHNYRTAADLSWERGDTEIAVEEDQMNSGINRLGNFVYGIVEGEQESCFVYSQGYPLSGVPAGYDNPTEGSRGFIRGIDCQAAGSDQSAEFLPIIESLRVHNQRGHGGTQPLFLSAEKNCNGPNPHTATPTLSRRIEPEVCFLASMVRFVSQSGLIAAISAA